MKYIVMFLMFSICINCSDSEDIVRSRNDFINSLSFFMNHEIDYHKFEYFERLIVKNQDIYDAYIQKLKGVHDVSNSK